MNMLIGQTIRSYVLQELIGEGGTGMVYRGVDIRNNESVAVKHLKPPHSDSAIPHLERFRREGELLRAMNHPNIVKLLDIAEDDGEHFLVLEYVPGGSLRDLLDHQPQLPLERVLWIALDMADALTRAHRLNVIHRDLKPENVLLADDGTPRLTDFGIAILVGSSSLTQEGALVGTPMYLSPEAIDGHGIDKRGDIWSFGVMLFEMLAGTVPFAGERLTTLLNAIAHTPTPDLEALRPNAPVALVDLVYRMLEKDPVARIPSVRLVGAELEALLRQETLSGGDVSASLPRRTLDNVQLISSTTPIANDAPRHNLPAEITPFVGREDELAAIARLLASLKTCLITILAPGGMGKTRLSIEAATQHLAQFEQGVWFVGLAPLTETSQIVPAIADALGFQFMEEPPPKMQLLNYLRDKTLLLVLDNFEHLLDGAELINEILGAAPSVKVLVTSRERLNLGRETVFTLDGMDVPDLATPENASSYAAVKLFISGATRANPGFALSPDDLPHVARICHLVTGLPLGIVLSAAWADMLSVSEIADEIAHGLDFLETDQRDVPDRHRSMRAVLESAWTRLDDTERDAFMKLSVFQGGFTRQAVQEVTGMSLRGLMALANKSLLRRDPESGRYEVHELLRQFAEEQLDASVEGDAAHDIHSAYYTALMHQQGERMKGPEQFEAFEVLRAEVPNLSIALQWALKRDHLAHIEQSLLAIERLGSSWAGTREVGKLLVAPLAEALTRQPETLSGDDRGRTLLYAQLRLMQMKYISDHQLKSDLAEPVLTLIQDFDLWPELRINVVASILSTAIDRNLLPKDEAIELGQQAMARYHAAGEDYEFMLSAGSMAAMLAREDQRHDEGIALLNEAIAICERLRDRWIIVFNLTVLGVLHHDQGNFTEARHYSERAVAIAQKTPLQGLMQLPTMLLSSLSYVLGDFEAALHYGTMRLELALNGGDPTRIAEAYEAQGDIYLPLGDLENAQRYFDQALPIYHQFNDPNEARIYRKMAHIAILQDDLKIAKHRMNAARAVYDRYPREEGREHSLRYWVGQIAYREGNYATARQYFEACRDHSQEESRTIWEVPEDHAWLARVLIKQGEFRAARDLLHESIDTIARFSMLPIILLGTLGVAELMAAQGEHERAVELAALVREHDAAHFREKQDAESLLRTLRADLPPDQYSAAFERGAALALDATTQQLIDELSSPINTPPGVSALHETLTERELEVLALLAQGLSNRQIAHELVLAVGTVKTHIHNIYGKLSVRNRTEATIRARDLGLV